MTLVLGPQLHVAHDRWLGPPENSPQTQPIDLPCSDELVHVLGLLGRHRVALTHAEDPTAGNLGGRYLASLAPATVARLKGILE